MDDVVTAAVAAVTGVDMDVSLLTSVQFEQPLYDVYMYPSTLSLPPFGWPSLVLCHNLVSLAFWCSKMLWSLAVLTLFMKA